MFFLSLFLSVCARMRLMFVCVCARAEIVCARARVFVGEGGGGDMLVANLCILLMSEFLVSFVVDKMYTPKGSPKKGRSKTPAAIMIMIIQRTSTRN